MRTIRESDLDAVLRRINDSLDHPQDPWSPQEDGSKPQASVGTYVLDWAYGGVRLWQIAHTSGAQRDFTARSTKREAYNLMHAFLSGLAAAHIARVESAQE